MEEIREILIDKFGVEDICELIMVYMKNYSELGDNPYMLKLKNEKEIYGATQEKLRELPKEESNFLAKHCEDDEKLKREFVEK